MCVCVCVCVCLCILTPPKLLRIQISHLARLITSQSECHKGVRDVVFKDNFFKFAFFDKGKRYFLLKREPAPT